MNEWLILTVENALQLWWLCWLNHAIRLGMDRNMRKEKKDRYPLTGRDLSAGREQGCRSGLRAWNCRHIENKGRIGYSHSLSPDQSALDVHNNDLGQTKTFKIVHTSCTYCHFLLMELLFCSQQAHSFDSAQQLQIHPNVQCHRPERSVHKRQFCCWLVRRHGGSHEVALYDVWSDQLNLTINIQPW